MTLSPKRPLRVMCRALPLLALAALLGAGCATVPKEAYLVEPASRLEYPAQVYLRASGPALRGFVASLGDEDILALAKALKPADPGQAAGSGGAGPTKGDLSYLDGILKRSRTVGAGIRGIGGPSPGMEAVLVGDFVPLSLRFGLAFDGSWRRTQDGGYRSVKYPLFIRPPEPGIVRLSSEASGPVQGSPRAKPFPDAFAPLSASDFFVSVNEPQAVLALPLPAEAGELPIRAIAIAGTYAESYLLGKDQPAGPAGDPSYSVELRILMKDEASARAYRPIVRFLWAAAADRFFGRGSPASSLPPTQEKDCYVVRGIELGGEDLKALVGSALLGLK